MYIHKYDLITENRVIDHVTLNIEGESVVLLDRKARKNVDLLNLMMSTFSHVFRNSGVNLWVSMDGIPLNVYNLKSIISSTINLQDTYNNVNISTASNAKERDVYSIISKKMNMVKFIFRYISSLVYTEDKEMNRLNMRYFRSRYAMSEDFYSKSMDMINEYTAQFLIEHYRDYQQSPGFFFIKRIDAPASKKQDVYLRLKNNFPNVQFILSDDDPILLQLFRSEHIIDVTDKPKVVDSFQTYDSSLEDICEKVLGIQIPQRSEHFMQLKSLVDSGVSIEEIKSVCWRYIDALELLK